MREGKAAQSGAQDNHAAQNQNNRGLQPGAITTINALLETPVFKFLSLLLEESDKQAGVVADILMTRSHKHLVAFAILWMMSQDDTKPIIVDNLRTLFETTKRNSCALANVVFGITFEDIENVLRGIDWEALIKQEWDRGQNNFLEISLRDLNKDPLGKPLWFNQLIEHGVLKVNPNQMEKIVVTTNVAVRESWATVFDVRPPWNQQQRYLEISSSLGDSNARQFFINPEFQQWLNAKQPLLLKRRKSSFAFAHHVISITAIQSHEKSDPVCTIRLCLPIGKEQYDLDIKSKEINEKFYQVFRGTALDKKFTSSASLTESVTVKFTGKANFRKDGSGSSPVS